MTLIEIVTPTDVVALYSTPDMSGFVYDNASLDEWYKQASADANLASRPNSIGSYSPGRIYAGSHVFTISGQWYGETRADALRSRNRLAAIYNDGEPVAVRVTDELGVTTREAWLLEREAPFRLDFTHYTFTLDFVAPDPRRYAPAEMEATGLPQRGSGLVWPLGTSETGLFFDWGTAGDLGQVSLTNPGGVSTFPLMVVEGAFGSGFRIVEIETGRELIYRRSTGATSVIRLDSRKRTARFENGGDASLNLRTRQWFSIPPNSTRRYQFLANGSATGTPMMTAYAAPAYL